MHFIRPTFRQHYPFHGLKKSERNNTYSPDTSSCRKISYRFPYRERTSLLSTGSKKGQAYGSRIASRINFSNSSILALDVRSASRRTGAKLRSGDSVYSSTSETKYQMEHFSNSLPSFLTYFSVFVCSLKPMMIRCRNPNHRQQSPYSRSHSIVPNVALMT